MVFAFVLLLAALVGVWTWLRTALWWAAALAVLGGYAGAIALYVLALFVLSLFIDREKPAGKHWRGYRRLAELSLALLLRVLRVRMHVTGLEKMPQEGRFLYTCNHRADYDPMVSMVCLRKYDMTFVSKKENFDLPLAGPLMHAAGVLSIDRENDRRAVRTIVQAIHYLQEDRTSIAIYPEGYCRRDKHLRMQPFRDGSLKIAQKAHVPVVVSTVVGTDEIMGNFLHFRHTDVYLDILAVLSPAEFAGENTHALGEEIWKLMDENLQKREGAPE